MSSSHTTLGSPPRIELASWGEEGLMAEGTLIWTPGDKSSPPQGYARVTLKGGRPACLFGLPTIQGHSSELLTTPVQGAPPELTSW